MGPVEWNGSMIPSIRVWWDDLKLDLETTVNMHDRQINYLLVEDLKLILYDSAGLKAPPFSGRSPYHRWGSPL